MLPFQEGLSRHHLKVKRRDRAARCRRPVRVLAYATSSVLFANLYIHVLTVEIAGERRH
jgi:transcriptional regulator of met regulon